VHMTSTTTFTPSHRGGSGPPLVCLHGILDTWRTWELVLPALEREHDVLAVTLPGHAGGPPLPRSLDDASLAYAVERAMDDAGIERARLVGNSLGGFVALQLAARGRAESVVALAPAGGWAEDDELIAELARHFGETQTLARATAPHVDQIVASEEGRRALTRFTVSNFEHIPGELLAHQMVGVAQCEALAPLLEYASDAGFSLDAEQIACPVRIVWGTADALLGWPAAAARYREEWLPNADWVQLEGVGHCPQLDVPTQTAQLILGFR
jgi:pimeloyl-ACP methyl ester carboxylesterase